MATSKFNHEEHYRGKDLVGKLAKFRITICGTGALGSNLTETMARQGFTNIHVIDFDRVENHNINTQVYGNKDVGALKVNALCNRIFRDVGVEIESSPKELTASNIQKLLKGSQIVIDVFDNSSSRKLVRDECRTKKISCLHGGLFEGYGEVCWDDKYLVPRDAEGDVCDYPLARNLIMLTVAILAEEITDFCLSDKPRMANWSITLKDLKISQL